VNRATWRQHRLQAAIAAALLAAIGRARSQSTLVMMCWMPGTMTADTGNCPRITRRSGHVGPVAERERQQRRIGDLAAP
jgi:hypothetical protein